MLLCFRGMLDAGAMLIQERLSTEQVVMRKRKKTFKAKATVQFKCVI